jgi:hypothetical protein
MSSPPPTRPFESLAWYHDAARYGFQDDRRPSWQRWASGWGLLRSHLSVFAIGMVALYAANLFFEPGARWAGWLILAWVALIAIHGIIVAMLAALRLWNDEPADEPLFVPVRNVPGSWNLPPPQNGVQDADFRTTSDRDGGTGTWNAWQTPEPTPDIPESERASWSEASAAAWLTRGNTTGSRSESDS